MTSLPSFELTPALEQALLKQIEAEAAKAAAEADKEAQYALAQKVQTDALLRAEKDDLNHDRYHHHYMFDKAVDSLTVGRCLNELSLWHRDDPECDMTITMRSPGGDVVAGMHLFDELDAYSLRGEGSHKVTMIVRGYAASMAGILLQAADERVIGRNASLLIHPVSSWAEGGLHELKDKVKWLDQLTDRVTEIFLERSEGKISRGDFIKSLERRDWWLTADESLNFGFADRLG